MTTFCSAGETARVTFPDGSIRDFPSPVEIIVGEEPIGTIGQWGFLYIKYSRNPNLFDYAGWIYEPVYNIRFRWVNFQTKAWVVEALSNTLQNGNYSVIPAWRTYASGRWSEAQSQMTPIDWYVERSGVMRRRRYRITVKNNLNATTIFDQVFSSQNYSVSCISVCPPNSLDCGDCCLSCDLVVNELSAIQLLINNL